MATREVACQAIIGAVFRDAFEIADEIIHKLRRRAGCRMWTACDDSYWHRRNRLPVSSCSGWVSQQSRGEFLPLPCLVDSGPGR